MIFVIYIVDKGGQKVVSKKVPEFTKKICSLLGGAK